MARWTRRRTARGRVRTPSPGSIATWCMGHWLPRWCAASWQRNGGRMHMQSVLVTGAGGFIGQHLVKRLVAEGCWVRAVDLKAPEYEPSAAHEFELLDLRRWENCMRATRGVDEVYNLAANMGGIGFIESHKAEIMHDHVLINIHMLDAARENGVKRYLYTSPACVYPGYRQNSADVTALKEEGAYPADPEDRDGRVTIKELVDMVASIARKSIRRRHDLTKPQGVRGRNSDNALLRSVLGWEPQTSLETGLGQTYRWIRSMLGRGGRLKKELAAA